MMLAGFMPETPGLEDLLSPLEAEKHSPGYSKSAKT